VLAALVQRFSRPDAGIRSRGLSIVKTILAASLLVAAASVFAPARSAAQGPVYSDALLDKVRAAARAVPGDLPHALRVLAFAEFKTPLSGAVGGAGNEVVDGVYTAFQVRYPHGWIMVDAGVDREVETDTSVTIHPDRYQRVQEALRGANLIVVTHEHHDHVAGVIHTPLRDLIAPRTVLTRAQVQTLLAMDTRKKRLGNSPLVRLTPADAARYLVIDYERLYPVAPGLVLVKSPGHTPGSQMVYVRLDSGSEILLVGDIAWFMAGIERRLPKPEGISREMGEDRAALQEQLDWLSGLTQRQRVVLVNSHDGAWLRSVVNRGILKADLDLGGH
jgi:glyoxylase-like metal-dependent hydrolase (beta-lactamase superfamily II)